MRPWPHLTDDLPAPRDDEPSSLRQDIADELADHLNCAFTRELHLARDEEKAKEKTLDRFGDPRRIARKLWLDAMQEKLMSQRMTFVALVVVLLASLGSTGLTWFLVDQARQVNQTMLDQSREANAALLAQSQELLSQSRDSNRALVEQGQKANEALLAKLGDLQSRESKSANTANSLEWNPVKVRLYTGEKPGQPAVGYEVKLNGFMLDTAKEATLTQQTNSEGIANFGLIRPGQHTLLVTTPWTEARLAKTVTILPGEGRTEEIGCPAEQLELAKVDFRVEWPDDMKDRNLWVLCHFIQQPRIIDGGAWSQLPDVSRHRLLVITPSGEVMNTQTLLPFFQRGPDVRVDGRQSLLQRNIGNAGGLVPLYPGFFIGSPHPQLPGQPAISEDVRHRAEQIATNSWAFLLYEHEAATIEARWPKATYRLRNLLVLRAGVEIDGTRLMKSPVLAGLLAANAAANLETSYRQQAPSPGRGHLPPGNGPFFRRWPGYSGPIETGEDMEKADKSQPFFSARSGNDDHWKIIPPSNLLELLRANSSMDRNQNVVTDPKTPSSSPAKND